MSDENAEAAAAEEIEAGTEEEAPADAAPPAEEEVEGDAQPDGGDGGEGAPQVDADTAEGGDPAPETDGDGAAPGEEADAAQASEGAEGNEGEAVADAEPSGEAGADEEVAAPESEGADAGGAAETEAVDETEAVPTDAAEEVETGEAPEADGAVQQETVCLPFEKTLGIVKPGAMHSAGEILSLVKQEGFTVLQKKKALLSEDLLSNLYGDVVNDSVTHMSQGPVMIFLLGKENAIEDFAKLCGPEDPMEAYENHPNSIRALYGTDIVQNAVYCSALASKVASDIHLFFPDVIVEPVEAGIGVRDYLNTSVMRTVIGGLTALCKAKPGDPVQWLGKWLVDNNPNAPVVDIPDK
eukprot:Nk52_evm13s2133 gene=Nk52_evmTU13s2133